jgi:thymidylate synthase (FAD)
LSQRYVDESDCDFIEPPLFTEDEKLKSKLAEVVERLQDEYKKLVERASKVVKEKYPDVTDKTLIRKMARQSARAILPNATETKLMVTANARAWRHFIEMRASEHAETEIRRVAVEILKILQKEAPNIFGDYRIIPLPDGTEAAETDFEKV